MSKVDCERCRHYREDAGLEQVRFCCRCVHQPKTKEDFFEPKDTSISGEDDE